MFMNVKSEEESEVDECDGEDDRAKQDPLQAVAEVLLLEKGDRAWTPDPVGDVGRVVGPDQEQLSVGHWQWGLNV